MRITKVSLQNFKNYRHLEVDLSETQLLVLVGKNGQGKTNFLESLVILALSKSFQTHPLKEMVNWYLHEEETGLPEYFHLKAEIECQGKHHELEVICGKGRKYPKTLKVDGLKTKPKDYVGKLRIVLFTPQDLNMIMLAPSLRRRYVDILISQVDPDYLEHLSRFQTHLKQRNRLLTQIKERRAQANELGYWDDQLAEHGGYLLWKRRETFEQLNQKLSSYYEEMSQESVELSLDWKKSWDAESLGDFQTLYRNYLSDKQSRDIEAENTCGGPHREDFLFRMNDRDLAHFGSRGECRSAVLSLKKSELDFLRSSTDDLPLVLFDDVFSELDVDRQKNLLSMFESEQVFITTTHLDHVPDHATVWTVEDGNINTT